MLPAGLELKEFEPQTATEAEWVALNALVRGEQAEHVPEELPETVDYTRKQRLSQPAFIEQPEWLVWQGDEAVAFGNVVISHEGRNQHMSGIWISVVPEWRRQGIGTELLGRIVVAAKAANRRLLRTGFYDAIPASAAFMQRIGGENFQAWAMSLLEIKDVDRGLMELWRQRADSETYELGGWDGDYPEEQLDEIAVMHQVMNSMPRGDLEHEDEVWTPDVLREEDRTLRARRTERWIIYARHRGSGAIAGYTQVFWNPDQPARLTQGDTGVFAEHREKGLGRWLKAAMIEKVMQERPGATHVRTWNASVNAPMLKINGEMGYKLVRSGSAWYVSMDKVQAYLNEKGIK